MIFKLPDALLIIWAVCEINAEGNNVDENDSESCPYPYMKSAVKSEERDYSSDYAANNAIFAIKIEEETSLAPKFSVEKQEFSSLFCKEEFLDFQCKYEYEEDTILGDSETSGQRTYIIQDKLCRFCRVQFRFIAHYEKHVKNVHPKQKPYVCPCCPFKITKRRVFLNHIKSAHPNQIILSRKCEPNQIYKCESCQTEHTGVGDFHIHNASQHEGMKMIGCDRCNARFSRFCELAAHDLEKHGMQEAHFRCKFCKNSFFRSDELEIHGHICKNEQIGPNSVESEDHCKRRGECHESFETVQRLTSHFQSQHPELKDRCVCKICRRRFTTNQRLEIHTDHFHADKGTRSKYDRRKKAFKCQYCEEEFEGLGLFEEHGMAAHAKDQKLFRCAECGDGFNRKHILKQHIHGVHRRPTIPCRYCNKLHPTLGRRNRHEKCCGKRKEREEMLRNNNEWADADPKIMNSLIRDLINAEKRYPCDFCHKGFDEKDFLKYHVMRQHEKAHVPCPHCRKYFSMSTDMRKHAKGCGKRRAFDSPKFYCKICRKMLHGNERWHTLNHKNYDNCFICDCRFHRSNNPEGLAEHMEKRHPDYYFNDNARAYTRITNQDVYS